MDVLLPNIGDFHHVPIIEILVSPGDVIAEGDTILVLESDKATLDVPSPAAGTIDTIQVKVGDQINCGDLILTLTGTGTSAATAPAAAPAAPTPPVPAAGPTQTAPIPTTTAAAPAPTQTPPHASPAARKMARENNVDLSAVTPTGRLNRIRPQDVRDFLDHQGNSSTAPAPMNTYSPAPSEQSAEERVPLSRMQIATIRALEHSWTTIPHVTHCHEIDITALEQFRKTLNADRSTQNRNTKLTILAFLIKAVTRVLARFPNFNARLEGETIVRLKNYHIGVVVDTPQGVTIPIIRDADRLGVWDIAESIQTLAEQAREGQLKLTQLQGGTFSLSSFGGLGAGNFFTPIISAPQVTMLGVGRAIKRPAFVEGELQERLFLPFSLSYDHRVINGANTAGFFTLLEEILLDIRRAIL